jgi:hypothetical protein
MKMQQSGKFTVEQQQQGMAVMAVTAVTPQRMVHMTWSHTSTE